MKVDGLSDGKAFSDVSFELHRGEILGIAGLEGCGKNEVIRAIFGKTIIVPVPLKSTIKHIPTASILLWNGELRLYLQNGK